VNLDRKLLQEIFERRSNGQELLLVLDEKGFEGKKGAAFCRKLEEYIHRGNDRECFARALWPEQPNRPKFPEWDYAVVLPRKSVEFIKREPVYFTFLLGHELEHVELYSSNYFCALHASWLYDNLGRIQSAKSLAKCYTFPSEEHCHREGKKLAIALFSEGQFKKAIERVSASVSEKENRDFFSWLKILSEKKPDFNLRKEFIDFCQPYKEELRKIFDGYLEKWKKAQRGELTMDKPLAVEIKNFENMFELNYEGLS
jgi:hypothetical protein